MDSAKAALGRPVPSINQIADTKLILNEIKTLADSRLHFLKGYIDVTRIALGRITDLIFLPT